jgi:hypothetical protein
MAEDKETKEKESKEKKIIDIGTALADIQKRADERKKVVDANNKALSDKRAARSAARKPLQTGDARLIGLATFGTVAKKRITTK